VCNNYTTQIICNCRTVCCTVCLIVHRLLVILHSWKTGFHQVFSLFTFPKMIRHSALRKLRIFILRYASKLPWAIWQQSLYLQQPSHLHPPSQCAASSGPGTTAAPKVGGGMTGDRGQSLPKAKLFCIPGSELFACKRSEYREKSVGLLHLQTTVHSSRHPLSPLLPTFHRIHTSAMIVLPCNFATKSHIQVSKSKFWMLE